MMITWADMVGVVSGMNEKGLTVTINAAKSAIPGQAKTPVTILAREILQYASSIEEAFDIAKKRKLFVSESLLIGSQQDNMAAIIERSPDQYDIVYPASDMIVCANHFQGKKFSNDPRNIDNIKGSDSNYRFKRMNQLLNDESLINAEDAVTILRDRNGLHGTELGLGNPLAINQLIAHHSVIFKPDQLMVWISTSPYQLGKFVAYDLKKVFSLNRETVFAQREIYEEELTISPDTFVYSNDFHGFMKYLEMTEKLHLFEMSADPLPDSFEMDYIKTNPNLYLAYFNLGEYYRSVKNFEKAGEFYQKALTREVAGENQRKKLEHLLQKSLNQ
jgi:tetratricopeptide (TPR) repeat protein